MEEGGDPIEAAEALIASGRADQAARDLRARLESGRGGLLALNGERKLSIRSRGLGAIEYEIARVATTQINHLVSQTEGKFEHPHFSVPSLFNQENISRIGVERQGIALENKWKANYSAFDFSKHLRPADDGGSPMQGLFFLKAREWRAPKKKPAKDEERVAAADERPADMHRLASGWGGATAVVS